MFASSEPLQHLCIAIIEAAESTDDVAAIEALFLELFETTTTSNTTSSCSRSSRSSNYLIEEINLIDGLDERVTAEYGPCYST